MKTGTTFVIALNVKNIFLDINVDVFVKNVVIKKMIILNIGHDRRLQNSRF